MVVSIHERQCRCLAGLTLCPLRLRDAFARRLRTGDHRLHVGGTSISTYPALYKVLRACERILSSTTQLHSQAPTNTNQILPTSARCDFRGKANRQSKIGNALVNANVPRSQLSVWQRCRVNCQTHAIARGRNIKRHT